MNKLQNITTGLGVAALMVFAMNSSIYASVKTDSRIESAAKDSYVFRTYLKDDDVNVQSKNGIVTLKGTVADDSHKSMAEDTVSSLPGVKNVDDQLQVKGERAENNSDGWIATKVKTALLFHRNVNGLKTDVNVQQGNVTLRGEADNQAQKDLTTEYAKGIEGVNGVTNDMTVASAGQPGKEPLRAEIDDASITAQAKMTLLYHRSTSALSTDVTTKNGVVTLTGKTQNGAEKDLATKLVTDVNGVKKVINDMTIASNTNG